MTLSWCSRAGSRLAYSPPAETEAGAELDDAAELDDVDADDVDSDDVPVPLLAFSLVSVFSALELSDVPRESVR